MIIGIDYFLPDWFIIQNLPALCPIALFHRQHISCSALELSYSHSASYHHSHDVFSADVMYQLHFSTHSLARSLARSVFLRSCTSSHKNAHPHPLFHCFEVCACIPTPLPARCLAHCAVLSMITYILLVLICI